MTMSPFLVRLAIVVVSAYGLHCIISLEADERERRRNIAIVVIFAVSMFFFGAAWFSLLINSLGV